MLIDRSQLMTSTTFSKAARSHWLLFSIVIAIGAALRLYLLLSTAYVWDEDREWIPLGRSIDFAGADQNLPWRSVTHHALAAYVIKLTSMVLGEHPLGYRFGYFVAGILTMYAVARLAWEWLSFRAGMVTALAMAFNEYHIAMSAIAMAKGLCLMCSAWTVLHFGRFLKTGRTMNLYYAAIFAGIGFLFYETTALLLPVCILSLVLSGKTAWFRRRELWVAAGIGLLIVLPDVLWNIINWEEGYGRHTGRLAGLGFNPHFVLFFGRDFVRAAGQFFGRTIYDPTPEYPSMNVLWGILLIGAVVLGLLRWRTLGPIGRLAVIYFCCVLVFFSLGEPGESRREGIVMVDAKAWFWVDQVLIGGALMLGWAVSRFDRKAASVAVVATLGICVYASSQVLLKRLNIPTVRVLISPNVIWPPDGRVVQAETHVSACHRCRPTLQLLETRVNRYDDAGQVPLAPETIDATLGTDDRQFLIPAETGPFPDRRFYAFLYQVNDGLFADQRIITGVTVTAKPSVMPFWAH